MTVIYCSEIDCISNWKGTCSRKYIILTDSKCENKGEAEDGE